MGKEPYTLFQTKSLGCNLETFAISSTGRLVKIPSYDPEYFTGELVFYTGHTSAWEWIEFHAHFRSGSLLALELAKANRAQGSDNVLQDEWTLLKGTP